MGFDPKFQHFLFPKNEVPLHSRLVESSQGSLIEDEFFKITCLDYLPDLTKREFEIFDRNVISQKLTNDGLSFMADPNPGITLLKGYYKVLNFGRCGWWIYLGSCFSTLLIKS